MYSSAAMALSNLAGLGALGQSGQFGAQDNNNRQMGCGLGSANLFTPSFKQEMQADVDSWLKDWDVGNE